MTLTAIGTATADIYCNTVEMSLTGFEDEVAWDVDIAAASAL